MLTRLRRLVGRHRLLAAGSALLYLILYLVSIQDVSAGGRGFQLRTTDWQRMFERIGPLTFEPVLQVTLPGVTVLLAPLNVLVGVTIAVLVSLGVVFTRAARADELDVDGRMIGLSTLLVGLACIAPGMLIVLAVPVPSSFVTIFQLLIPVALLLLIGALGLALHRG